MESKVRALYRKAKDTWKQYDEAEIRVREATSNDPWGASSTMMSRIADDCDHPLRYQSMFTMLYKRLTDYKHYKHVLKSLHLIDYLLKHANTRFVHDMGLRRDTLLDLTNYKFVENGVDCGDEIRTKAQQLIELLDDEEKLREERESARNTKGRISALDHKSSIGSWQRDDRAGPRKSKTLSRYDEEVEWEDLPEIESESEDKKKTVAPKKPVKKIASPDLEFDDAAFEEKELSIESEESEEVVAPRKQKTPEKRRTPSPKRAPVVAEKPKAANRTSFLDELDLLPTAKVPKQKSLDDIFESTQSGLDSLFDNVKPLALPAPEEKKEETRPIEMIDVSLLNETSPKDGEEWTYLTNFENLHVPMTKVRSEKRKEIKKALSDAKPKLKELKESSGSELVVYNPNPVLPAGNAYGYYGYVPHYQYGYPATAMVVYDPSAVANNASNLRWN